MSYTKTKSRIHKFDTDGVLLSEPCVCGSLEGKLVESSEDGFGTILVVVCAKCDIEVDHNLVGMVK